MRASAQDAFWGLTVGLEGYDDSLYVDILDLVTSGVGDLMDPMPLALGHPWLHRSDDSTATTDEIAAEWNAVKTGRIPSVRLCGGTPRPLYLKPEAVQTLVLNRLRMNEAFLVRRWSNWAQWPADGQLGAHAVAWAAGAKWAAPHFDKAALAMDFRTIAGPVGDASTNPLFRGEAWLRDTGNPGLHRRNLIVKTLFQNAANVLSCGLDPDVLLYPRNGVSP